MRLSHWCSEEEPDAEALAVRAVPHLTAAGEEAATRLTQARSEEVRTLLEDWEPEQHPEVLQLVNRFARSLSRTPPAEVPTPA